VSTQIVLELEFIQINPVESLINLLAPGYSFAKWDFNKLKHLSTKGRTVYIGYELAERAFLDLAPVPDFSILVTCTLNLILEIEVLTFLAECGDLIFQF
jgi:hypothetical protein